METNVQKEGKIKREHSVEALKIHIFEKYWYEKYSLYKVKWKADDKSLSIAWT